MKACIDLTANSSIAGQALEALSSQDKQVVKDKISKTLKKAINKNVKDVVLDVAQGMLGDNEHEAFDTQCCTCYEYGA
jgi:hypothetical protein